LPDDKRYIRLFICQGPQQTLGTMQMMKSESFQKFLSVSFWHYFVISGKNCVTALGLCYFDKNACKLHIWFK